MLVNFAVPHNITIVDNGRTKAVYNAQSISGDKDPKRRMEVTTLE